MEISINSIGIQYEKDRAYAPHSLSTRFMDDCFLMFLCAHGYCDVENIEEVPDEIIEAANDFAKNHFLMTASYLEAKTDTKFAWYREEEMD